MATNRFFQSTAVQDNVQPFQLPVEQLGLALAAEQERFDEGQDLADDLSTLSITAEAQDRARANELLSGFESQVDDIVNDFDGNFARANKKLRRLKKQIDRDFKPGGEAFAIENQAKKVQDFITNNRERVGKDITAQQFENALSFVRSNFEGTKRDPVSGAFNEISIPEIANNVNVNERATAVAKNIVPQILSNQGFEFSKEHKGFIRKFGNKVEVLPPERIQGIVLNSLAQDTELNNFLAQNAQFAGLDPNAVVAEQLNQAAINAANTFSRFNESTTEDITADPFALIAAREASARRTAKFKASLKKDDKSARQSLQFRYSQNFTKSNQPRATIGPLSGNFKLPGTESQIQGQKNLFNLFGGGAGVMAQAIAPGIVDGVLRFFHKNSADDVRTLLADPPKEQALLLKDVETALERSGVDLSSMTKNEANKVFAEKFNSYLDATTQAQSTEVAYGDETIKQINDSLIRSGAFRGLSFTYVDENGNVHRNKTFDQVSDLADIDIEDFQAEASVNGYNTPITGLANGEIVRHPEVEGRIIIEENNINSDKIFAPIRIMSAVLDPNTVSTDDTNGGRFSMEGLLPPSYGTSFRAVGTNVIDERGNMRREVSIINENGVDITRDLPPGLNMPLNKLTNLATQMVLKSGTDGIGTRKGTDNKLILPQN